MIDFQNIQFLEYQDIHHPTQPFVVKAGIILSRSIQINKREWLKGNGIQKEAKRHLADHLWFTAYGDVRRELEKLKDFVHRNCNQTAYITQIDEAFAPLDNLLARPDQQKAVDKLVVVNGQESGVIKGNQCTT